MRITISGPPGSGKTTVCGLLAERLGIPAVVFGLFFREMASQKGITLAEMGALAETDRSIDESIDARILDIARETDDMILESRLSAQMLQRNAIPAFKVYLDADPLVRAARVGKREDEDLQQAAEKMVQRQMSEAKRYKQYYGIDLYDLSVYDLIVDTADKTPDEIVDEIVSNLPEVQ